MRALNDPIDPAFYRADIPLALGIRIFTLRAIGPSPGSMMKLIELALLDQARSWILGSSFLAQPPGSTRL